MKDSIRRIQQDGFSKPLLALANRWRTQNSCAEYIKKDNEHCFLTLFNHNGLRWYHEGIVEKTSSVLLEISKDRVIEVDTASHKLLRVNGEEVEDVESNQVLDLSDDGERWEGDVLNNEPYGWGVLYDSENRIAYEGFRIGDVNVCYGSTTQISKNQNTKEQSVKESAGDEASSIIATAQLSLKENASMNRRLKDELNFGVNINSFTTKLKN